MDLRKLTSTEERLLAERHYDVTDKEKIKEIVKSWDDKKKDEVFIKNLSYGLELYKVLGSISHLFEHSIEFIEFAPDPLDLFKINPRSSIWIDYDYDKKLLYVNTENSNIMSFFRVYISEDTKKSFDILAFYFTPVNIQFFLKIEEAIIIKHASLKYYETMIEEQESLE